MIMMRPNCSHDHSCFGWKSCCVWIQLEQPFCYWVDYTFTFTNGTAGSADYTTTSQTVTVPAGATTGTVSVPTTDDTIAESMRPLLPLELLRLLEQSMIMMRLQL
jgi:hypothetical protein